MAEAGTAQKRSTGEDVGSDYHEKRQLKQGAAGWVLLAGLGVAYVISGDFAGWNFGLAEGGWGGLLIATLLMATMYTCMVFGLAELASAISGRGRRLRLRPARARPARRVRDRHRDPDRVRHRAGRDRRSSSAATSRRSGCSASTSGWPVYLACYVIFVGIHLLRRRRGARLMFVITAIAVVALLVFVVGDDPRVRPRRTCSTSSPTSAAGAWTFIPFGWRASGRLRLRRSGSSWRSRASRSPPRRHATRSGTCRAG